MRTLPSLLLLLALPLTLAERPPQANINYDGNSLNFDFDAAAGATLLGLHYSVNQELNGVAVGQVNIDLFPDNGRFQHSNRLSLQHGDYVAYWYVAIIYGRGYQLTNQRWVFMKPTTPAPTYPPTTGPTTTARPWPTATARPPKPTTSPETGCVTYPCLIFEDNFDFLDFKKWQHEITAGGGGNWEFQYYHNSRTNSFTRDGKLFIKPTLTEDDLGLDFVRTGTLDLWGTTPSNVCTGNAFWGCMRSGGGGRVVNPVQSARLRSVNSFAFRYGKIEVEAKLPAGDWLWPAIWLLPRDNEYGEWPRSGEIDLMEARGNRNLREPNGVSGGIDQMGMTMHWGPKYPYNGYPKTHAVKNLDNGKTFADGFHKYQLEWGPDIGLVFSLDGEHIFTANPPNGFWDLGRDLFVDSDGKPMDEEKYNPWKPSQGATRLAPFDKPFSIILNVAVGGTNGYFADHLINAPYQKPWRNDGNYAMTDFYNAKHLWYPTWKPETDDSAMQVNYVRVWKMQRDP